MQCDICSKKKATVHLTEIVDEQMTELHLCEDCAREKSAQMEQQFGLADLLAGLTDFSKPTTTKAGEKIELTCANCGLTYENFRKLGRLGCSECYVSFHDQLAVLLKKIHGSGQHLGTKPTHTAAKAAKTVKGEGLADLKVRLLKAIQAERFEEAALLRDKIRSFEKKGNTGKS